MFLFILLIILSAGFELLSLGLIIPAIGTLIEPTFLEEFFQDKMILTHLSNLTQSQIILIGIISIGLIYITKAFFLTYSTYWQTKFGRDFHANISKKLFCTYLSRSYSFHININSSNLIRNINIEAGTIYSSLLSVMTLFMDLVLALSITFFLIKIEPLGSILVIIVLSIIGLLFSFFSKSKISVWGEKKVFHQGKSIQTIMEGLAGIKMVKLLGKQSEFYNRFSNHIFKFANFEKLNILVNQLPRIWLEFFAILALCILMLSILFQGKDYSSVLPVLALFTGAAFRLIPSINKILNSIQVLNFNHASIDIIYNDIFLKGGTVEILKADRAKIIINTITLEKINFKYPNTDTVTIRNLNFQINKNESIGIIGDSGSGKSTIVDIILGLLIPQEGKVLVNGENIFGSPIQLRSWQNSIGYVPQDIYLIDDTIANNIMFGFDKNKINKNALKRVLENSQLDEFVQSLPDGINTIVGERGVRLSGGQIQRIGIARALYNHPSILIFDEATSSLDSDTENSIIQCIDNLKGKTKIIVAHRLSTVRNCDKVIKINKGAIEKIGKLNEISTIK